LDIPPEKFLQHHMPRAVGFRGDGGRCQMLDLFVCLRPVRYFTGVPSPVKHSEKAAP
jgi:hypothetical protein